MSVKEILKAIESTGQQKHYDKYRIVIAQWGLLKLFCDPGHKYLRGIQFGYTDTNDREIRHRLDGPAVLWFNRLGGVQTEEYHIENRLHREDGPAIIAHYKTGSITTEYYFLRGVPVADFVVLSPTSITLDNIKFERNIESKRTMIERYGWQRWLEDVKAKLVDERVDEVSGTKECLFTGMRNKLLVCACPSTGRLYPIQVPWRIKTCVEAQQYLAGRRMQNMQIIGAS